jgi:hypothetical protein
MNLQELGDKRPGSVTDLDRDILARPLKKTKKVSTVCAVDLAE